MGTLPHRLAAVVITDLVGFSRLMSEDESGTLASLRAHRNAIDPVVLNHGGRLVKTTGDGMLLEFPSATDALGACVAMQDLMRQRNAELPDSRRMQFRIGINLADVAVDEDGDIFGDGVNVAARIEPLAEPGGIAVTTSVREAVRGKVDVVFSDGGEHELKNISEPVQVWKIGGEDAVVRTAASSEPTRRVVATVAVLPFANMSDDAEQEYFADGITEDLLTALAHERYLAVVARNSVFAYKGRAGDVRTVARELDATHLVEGSVRRAGRQVRITAQLIDAESGMHLWAERYDRGLDDIFAVQDEVVDAITARLRPTLWERATTRRTGAADASIDAWDLYLRALHEYNTHSIEGFLAAIELAEQAIELDPRFGAPVGLKCACWLLLGVFGWRGDVSPWRLAVEAGRTAYELDPDDPTINVALAALCTTTGETDRGLRFATRAIELNPHSAEGYHMLGANLNCAARPEEAIEALSDAWRLGRYEPFRYDIANDLAWAHYLSRRYEPALTWGLQGLSYNPEYLQLHLVLAATCGQLERRAEGEQHVAFILAARPDFTVSRNREHIIYQDEAAKGHIAEGLLRAGLPP